MDRARGGTMSTDSEGAELETSILVDSKLHLPQEANTFANCAVH